MTNRPSICIVHNGSCSVLLLTLPDSLEHVGCFNGCLQQSSSSSEPSRTCCPSWRASFAVGRNSSWRSIQLSWHNSPLNIPKHSSLKILVAYLDLFVHYPKALSFVHSLPYQDFLPSFPHGRSLGSAPSHQLAELRRERGRPRSAAGPVKAPLIRVDPYR